MCSSEALFLYGRFPSWMGAVDLGKADCDSLELHGVMKLGSLGAEALPRGSRAT